MPAYAYTSVVDRSRREIKGGYFDCDLDNLSIEQAIEKLSELKSDLPENCSREALEIDTDYEYGDTYLVSRLNWYRLETDEERDERIRKTEEYNAEVKDRKRRQFEALKKELGEK